MKIFPINNNLNRNISFNAGKTKFYTDFDGTFFPFEQYSIEYKEQPAINDAKKMYDSFGTFMKKAGDKFSLLITTGRTQFEMLRAMLAFKKSGIEYIDPQIYVLEDGGKVTKRVDDRMCLPSSRLFSDTLPLHHNKLTQTKRAVNEIIIKRNNDLVIVAGNDYNDRDMLNPLNYIDIFGVKTDKYKPVEETLAEEKVLSAIKKLPLVSIIAGNNYTLIELIRMKEILDEKGIHKIFYAQNPSEDLLKCVKQGMKTYSQENEDFKNNLGIELYSALNTDTKS